MTTNVRWALWSPWPSTCVSLVSPFSHLSRCLFHTTTSQTLQIHFHFWLSANDPASFTGKIKALKKEKSHFPITKSTHLSALSWVFSTFVNELSLPMSKTNPSNCALIHLISPTQGLSTELLSSVCKRTYCTIYSPSYNQLNLTLTSPLTPDIFL